MEPGADRGDGRGVLVGDREARPDGDGPLDEQADRRVLAERDRSIGRASPPRFIRSSPVCWLGSGGAGRPGTGYSCSPETCSDGPARDDRLDVRRGAQQVGDDRGGGDDLLEVVEDEQEPLVAQPVGERFGDRACAGSRRRRARSAIRGATSIGSRIGSSGTKKTPSGKSSDDRAASWSESRVLPVPPGPVRVSSRVGASSRAAASSSASRPTNVVSWVGRLFGRASSERSGGKSDGRPSATTWTMRTGALRSLSRCSPRSRSVTPSTGLVVEQGAGRLGREDLAAVGHRREPGRPVDAEADEALPGLVGAAGVEAHPDPDRRVVRPRLGGRARAGRRRRPRRRPAPRERDEEGIALGALLDAAVRLGRRAEDLAVALAQLGVAVAADRPARGASSPRCR